MRPGTQTWEGALFARSDMKNGVDSVIDEEGRRIEGTIIEVWI